MVKETDRAKEYVYRLLALRPRTEKEITIKMKQKGFSQDIVDGVISLIKEYGYIDDADFAGMWVKNRCLLRPMGKRRLYEELHLKGVPKEIIETTLSGLTPEMEYTMARKIADRKMAKGGKEPRKLYSFLLRRGFSNEVVYKIIYELDKELLPD